jgi:hypothetical protein
MKVSLEIVLNTLMIKFAFERARRDEETRTLLCQNRTSRNERKGRNDHVVATRHSCAPRLISRPTSKISSASLIISIKILMISGLGCDHLGSIHLRVYVDCSGWRPGADS